MRSSDSNIFAGICFLIGGRTCRQLSALRPPLGELISQEPAQEAPACTRTGKAERFPQLSPRPAPLSSKLQGTFQRTSTHRGQLPTLSFSVHEISISFRYPIGVLLLPSCGNPQQPPPVTKTCPTPLMVLSSPPPSSPQMSPPLSRKSTQCVPCNAQTTKLAF